MYRADLFPRVLRAEGLLGGLLLVVDALFFSAPQFGSVRDALQVGLPLAWMWMVWTGVLMWRRTPN